MAAAQEGIESLTQTINDIELREHFLKRALACLPKEKSNKNSLLTWLALFGKIISERNAGWGGNEERLKGAGGRARNKRTPTQAK